MEDLLGRLSASTEAKRARFGEGFGDLAKEHGLLDWEGWFHPYDSEVHQTVAQHVLAQDVVLEIGAGDLRLALRLSQRAQRVYAVEVNSGLLQWAMQEIGPELPHNLHVICANALYAPIPRDVTVAVLLMRHCQHFGTYFDRLQAAGSARPT